MRPKYYIFILGIVGIGAVFVLLMIIKVQKTYFERATNRGVFSFSKSHSFLIEPKTLADR